ncbi:membrane protein insertase YidC [Buchnera aphidicola]|uniref:membrane protein insertase YidC n=1 Tax=Buchnera aphidicola TaxID=9 RepID=UPI0031B6D5C7
MDFQRYFFIFIILILSFFLFRAWNLENNISNNVDINLKNRKNINLNFIQDFKRKYINVRTDVLSLNLNLLGGDVEEADLLLYKKNLKEKKSFTLLKNKKNFLYKIVSGISGKEGIDFLDFQKRPLYLVNFGLYRFKKNEKILKVPLFWKSSTGILYIKTFIFKKGHYDFDIEYSIYNPLNQKLNIILFSEIHQMNFFSKYLKNTWRNFLKLKTYYGAAYSCDQKNYIKYSFDSIKKNKNFSLSTKHGWISMLQQYFSVAIIPRNNITHYIYSYFLKNNISVIGISSENKIISPHSMKKFIFTYWVGPSIYKYLNKIVPYLTYLIDYGWFWLLSQVFLQILLFFYSFLHSWGLSIIFITVCVRSIMFPLMKLQYRSMNKIKKIQPEISKIQKKFFGNTILINQKILALYQKENINPLNSFLPMLIQMPIFLALYHMLMEAVELRHSSFLFWIKDLSNQDEYYILPFLMGLSMFFMNLNTSKNDSNLISSKMIYFIPIMFTIFFSCFPSGLVLYYLISNLVTILQQKIIFFKYFKN